ncbi:MAG: FhaA domain-containing protein [Agromyces sp.]
MGLLDNIERGLERFVNGAFAKTFRSGLQPVEITAALKRELDTKAAVVARDRVLVPNRFVVRMAHEDFERMQGLGPTLIDELMALVQKHAKSQHYQFAGGLSIRLQDDLTLSAGMLQVDSQTEQGEVAWTPVLDLGTSRVELKIGRLVIGRGSEADLTIDDSGASRKHAAVEWDGARARIRDLGSTNGTQLDGLPVVEAILEPESVITIGRTRIVFRILAAASGQPIRPGGDAQPPTQRMDGFWSES